MTILQVGFLSITQVIIFLALKTLSLPRLQSLLTGLIALPSFTHSLVPKSRPHMLGFAYNSISLLAPISTSLFIPQIMLYQKQTSVACADHHLVLFMNLQVRWVLLLFSTGSLMYRLSAVGQLRGSVGLSWDWLTIGSSGMAWLGQLGFSSCGRLSSSRPAWLIYMVTRQGFKRSRTTEVSQVLCTLTLLSCSVCKSKS